MRSRLASLVLALIVSAFAGHRGERTARSTATPPLTIYAAASLTEVFKALDPAQNYSFAGSNALETQIRNGAPADIFASAAPLNTQRLFKAGIVDKPVTFTANRLALIVPKSNPAGIKSIYDLRSKPVKLVVAAPAVPVGGYTLTVLRKMGLSGVLSKVVSRESDVKAVTGKVALGQADAGFVYVTDARAGERPGDRDPDPGVGAAACPLRDRRRLEVGEQGRGAGVDQRRSCRRRARRRSRTPASSRSRRHRRRPPLPRDARPRHGRRARASCSLPDRRDLPARPAGRARLGARQRRGEGRARRHGEDEPGRRWP